jgi:hypothetical protein
MRAMIAFPRNIGYRKDLLVEGIGKKPIAIACQGGGSHTAFTAGALKRLLRDERYEVVALSGTSGGAICALLAWYALLQNSGEAGGGAEIDGGHSGQAQRAGWQPLPAPGDLLHREDIEKINYLIDKLGEEDESSGNKRLRIPGEEGKEYRPIRVRRIEMLRELDFASKLDRSPSFIRDLMDYGEERAEEFLAG